MSSELENFSSKSKKTIENLSREFQNVRGGRVSVNLLDKVRITAYGELTSLKNHATISTTDSKTIVIKPFDISLIQEIEKSITKSDLGVNPTSDGKMVKLNFPPMSGERRKEIVKNIKTLAENSKVAIRNIRRDSLEALKKQKKDKDNPLSDDEEKRISNEIQKQVDNFNKEIDVNLQKKEKELLEE